MEAKAILKYVRTSPRKTRLVADMVRGKKVNDALNILTFTNKKPAKVIKKLLESAMANAEEKKAEDVDSLTVSKLTVDGGPVWKRQLPRVGHKLGEFSHTRTFKLHSGHTKKVLTKT